MSSTVTWQVRQDTFPIIPLRFDTTGPRGADVQSRVIRAARAEGVADTTLRSLLQTLAVLGGDPCSMTCDEVRDRVAARGYAPSSAAVVLSRVSRLCEMLGCPDHPATRIRRPRRPRATPKPITDEQWRILMDAWPPGTRWREWAVLAAYAGLRAGEIAVLRGRDLELWESGPKVRVHGKGGSIATVPAHPLVVDVFAAHDTDGRLWPDVTPSSVSEGWRRAARRAGVPVSIHQARHRFGTRAYAASRDLLAVQRIMRHDKVSSTMGYVALDDDAAVRAVSGL